MTTKKDETLPVVKTAWNELDFSDKEMLETLRATVAVGTTDPEFKMFIEFCKGTRLNPFKREAWCIVVPEKEYTKRDGTKGKKERQVQIMTGINGYFAVANDNPQYDGLEVETERDASGKPRHVTVKAYRKDRSRPSIGEAWIDEDAQPMGGYGTWDRRPSTMLAKVAKARALRELFPQILGGTFTDDEMPAEYALEPQAALPSPAERARELEAAKAKIAEVEKAEAKEGARYIYNFNAFGISVPDKVERLEKWKAAQALGAIGDKAPDGKALVFSPVPLPGWENYLIDGPGAPADEDLPDFLSMRGEA